MNNDAQLTTSEKTWWHQIFKQKNQLLETVICRLLTNSPIQRISLQELISRLHINYCGSDVHYPKCNLYCSIMC